MAIISGTALTYTGQPGLQGLREDLSDMIYNVSPDDHPFMSNVGRGTADAVLHSPAIIENQGLCLPVLMFCGQAEQFHCLVGIPAEVFEPA